MDRKSDFFVHSDESSRHHAVCTDLSNYIFHRENVSCVHIGILQKRFFNFFLTFRFQNAIFMDGLLQVTLKKLQ